jgi:cation:H+ antiporter
MIDGLGTLLQLNTNWQWIVTAFTGDSAVKMLVGFVLLYVGAESLVKGASRFSTDLGMRAAIAGVTVIAFATTAPELAIAVLSGLNFGETLGLGAIIGSNIANIGLVLGVSSLIQPLEVSDETVKRHLPFMLLAAVLFVVFGLDGTITRIEGVGFLLALAAFTYTLIVKTDPEESEIVEGIDEVVDEDDDDDAESADADSNSDSDSGVAADGGTAAAAGLTDRLPFRLRDLAFILLGLVLLVYGARQLIQGGRTTLYYLGAGDRFVGLTVLALGTSLPELAASVVSAIRGQDDFSVGNVVGSNIYNILAVIGILALITPSSVPDAMIGTDFPFLIGATGLAAAFFVARGKIGRLEGLTLLAAYGFYMSLLL